MLSPMARACCRRIITASAKPRSSMTMARIMYMIPIFLWSMLQIQSFHSGPHSLNLVMPASTARPPSTTAIKVTSTMGSCAIGMESQVMRPNSQWAEEVCSDMFVSLEECFGLPQSGNHSVLSAWHQRCAGPRCCRHDLRGHRHGPQKRRWHRVFWRGRDQRLWPSFRACRLRCLPRSG